MVDSITIEGMSCTKVADAVGNLTLTPKSGNPLTIDIGTFLRSNGGDCTIYVSILVYSG
jgi:hypothetical protein